MKADMEAMKEHMATMMEAMMSMKKIMEVNVAVVSTVCRFWGGLDSPVWPQPNKSSNLRYGWPIILCKSRTNMFSRHMVYL